MHEHSQIMSRNVDPTDESYNSHPIAERYLLTQFLPFFRVDIGGMGQLTRDKLFALFAFFALFALFAATIHLRKNEIAARYGGEEFLILLPETGIEGATTVAQKIRKTLATKEWKLKQSGETMGTITVSMGISLYRLNEPEESLIKRADDALFLAKNNGRNKVITQEEL